MFFNMTAEAIGLTLISSRESVAEYTEHLTQKVDYMCKVSSLAAVLKKAEPRSLLTEEMENAITLLRQVPHSVCVLVRSDIASILKHCVRSGCPAVPRKRICDQGPYLGEVRHGRHGSTDGN